MSSDHISETNIVTGDVTASAGSITAIGNNITITVNGREESRLFVGVPPLPGHSVVGREMLAEAISKLLLTGSNAAITALGGKPGVGKTTLATYLAHEPTLLAHFRDGVLWASPGPNSNVEAALSAWADALRVDLTDQPTANDKAQKLKNAIGQHSFLIIIDDVWDEDAANLLHGIGGPTCAHLLTTRDDTLARRFAPHGWQSVGDLADKPALELLRELCPTAVQAASDVIDQLIATVGKLPLALVLIGGILTEFTIPTVAKVEAGKLLADVNRWLSHTDSQHPQSLDKLISLSIARLPAHASLNAEQVQAAFLRLAAFAAKPASFSLEAAQTVSGVSLSVINTFIQRNLLEQVGEERVTIHQTIAALASQRATALDAAHLAHAEFYLQLMTDNDKDSDWPTIEAEWEQIKHAWAWLSSTAEAEDLALPYIWAAGQFMRLRGYGQELIAWLERGLEVARKQSQHKDEATLLNNIGLVYSARGDKAQALDYLQQALTITRMLDDRSGEANTINSVGGVYNDMGDNAKALDYLQQALTMRRQVDDRAGEATTLNNIGRVYSALGDKVKALDYLQQALTIQRQVGDHSGEATTVNNIGSVYDALGDKAQALHYYQQTLPITRQVGNRSGEARTLNNIGLVYSALGDNAKALDYLQQALPITRQVSDHSGEATTLNNIGLVYSALGDKARALHYYQQALPIMQQADDRSGEAGSRYNIAMIYVNRGDYTAAVAELERVVALDEAVQHPDLVSDRATLEQIRQCIAQPHNPPSHSAGPPVKKDDKPPWKS